MSSLRHANVAIFVPHLGCPHDCSFCNQREIAGKETPPSPDEVRKTLSESLGQMGERAEQSEIAFFGGSFTAIERSRMLGLLDATQGFVGPGRFHGIRLSTRPDAIDEEILDLLKQYGVTAIELGAQSMDDRVLNLNGRGHTAAQVAVASGLIKGCGFELGLQMMTGLYGDTPEGALQTARALAALNPDTMRVYPTIVLRGTALAALYEKGSYQPQSVDEAVTLCAELLLFFKERGIPVIRLGLHASESLEEARVAGPWHPAFRELCEGRVYYERAKQALKGFEGRQAVINLPGRDISKLTGQRGKYLRALESDTGCSLTVKGAELEKYEVKINLQA